jgi:hypothetical protein
VRVYTNDWHAWRIVAGADFFMNDFNGALSAYTNAVRLGDDLSYPALGLTAIKLDRLDVVREIVPRLLVLKNSKNVSRNQGLQLATVLLVYSLKTDQKELFMKAIEGFDPKEILAHDDVTFPVRQGCNQFKGKDIDSIRQVFEGDMGNNSSSTNTKVSPR